MRRPPWYNRPMRNSRYNAVHAAAASAALTLMAMGQGPTAFWRQFLHGIGRALTLQDVRNATLLFAAIMGAMLLVLWLSTLFTSARRSAPAADERPPVSRLRALGLAIAVAPVATIAACAVQMLCAAALERMCGARPADQDLVRFLADPACSAGAKAWLALAVLVQAPLLEEALFRGVIFRGFARAMPTAAAMALSGFVFALVHVNAASFAALWLLGATFAWLYARTRTIVAPIAAHCCFNAINLVMLMLFPQLGQT